MIDYSNYFDFSNDSPPRLLWDDYINHGFVSTNAFVEFDLSMSISLLNLVDQNQSR